MCIKYPGLSQPQCCAVAIYDMYLKLRKEVKIILIMDIKELSIPTLGHMVVILAILTSVQCELPSLCGKFLEMGENGF